eukprot:767579-Hanusia_phi.AAC.8
MAGSSSRILGNDAQDVQMPGGNDENEQGGSQGHVVHGSSTPEVPVPLSFAAIEAFFGNLTEPERVPRGGRKTKADDEGRDPPGPEPRYVHECRNVAFNQTDTNPEPDKPRRSVYTVLKHGVHSYSKLVATKKSRGLMPSHEGRAANSVDHAAMNVEQIGTQHPEG